MKSKENKKQTELAWDQLYELYERVQDVPDAERRSLLESLCPGRPEIHAEVLALVSESPKLSKFLEGSAAARLAVMLEPESFKSGDLVEDFFISGVLGRGAFATVYRAIQNSLDREVALKVSPDFGQEGRTIAQLEHEGIVPVYSQTTLKARNLRLIAMQYVAAVTLEKLAASLALLPAEDLNGATVLKAIDDGLADPPALTAEAYRDRDRLSHVSYPEIVAWIGAHLARALDHAHGEGILHLDIKASNILVPATARPKLTDFNVSIDVESLEDGIPAQFGGTADFMAPEHKLVFTTSDKLSAVRALDGRADVYSLGIMLQELLQVGAQARVTDELNWIVSRATEADPARRYQDADAFAKALDGYGELRAILASLPSTRPWLRPIGKHPILWLTVLGAVPQVIGCTFGITYNAIRIVADLSPHQRELFRALNWTYNPFLYVLVSVLWLWGMARFRPLVRRPADYVGRQAELSKLRACMHRTPLFGAALTTLGWMPGAVGFPAFLHFYGGGLSLSTSCHFFISFFLSYGIALAYSFLIHEWILLRTLYKRFWPGSESIAETARRELAPIPKRVRIACVLAAFIPLLGATIVILVGPDNLSERDYKVFRFLTTSLIVMGGVGMSFAFSAAQEIGRMVVRFTNGTQEARTRNK